jgi:hypothetical protein
MGEGEEAEKRDSGVIPLADGDVGRACGEIIDAAALAVVNLDFAARGVDPERREALHEVQHAIDRIVELAKRVRRTQRTNAK